MTTPAPFVTVVSGLPRSGTSLVMQMLQAGGMPVLTDNVRAADDDNPVGYLEFEAVKRTGEDASWVLSAAGKAVKVIYKLLVDLPADYSYRVIFLRRDLREVIASQAKMLARRGTVGAKLGADQLARVFDRQLKATEAWLAERSHFSVLYVEHRGLITNPRPQVEEICRFLDVPLDADAMCDAVKPKLYRQRTA
jgi:Sulfotransferase family